jgi:hypothetical protein
MDEAKNSLDSEAQSENFTVHNVARFTPLVIQLSSLPWGVRTHTCWQLDTMYARIQCSPFLR